jgi:hypothetical protein
MRLIDADALIERLDDFNKWCKDERLQGSLFAVDVVGDMPTVDVLDKIRAEIEEVLHEPEYQHEDEDWATGLCIAQEIIDKYR